MGEEVSHLKAHVNTFYNNGALQRASEQPHLKTNQKPSQINKKVGSQDLSARRLIWLNPLLRWDGFAPKAQGVAAMLPHVDSFRAGHSIASLEDLATVISTQDDVGEKARLMSALPG